MTRTLILAACLVVGGCASMPGQTSNAEVLKALGEHIDKCDRQYQGGLGIGASFTFNINCKAQPAPVPAPSE